MSDTQTEGKESVAGRGLRSPGYPACTLKVAIEKARTLKDYQPARKPIPIDSALKALGYSVGSGAGMQMIASLKKFGLVEDAGSLDQRTVRVSDLAWKIIGDVRPQSPDRDKATAEAALSPKIHAEIRERWPHGLPDDATIGHWLTMEKAFNEKSVAGFLKDLRQTFEYAKLDLEPFSGKDGGEEAPSPPKVGDFVQWASQGTAQFASPRKVLGLSEDGEFAFVEGTETGLPVSQLTVEKAAEPARKDAPPAPPRNPFVRDETPHEGITQATFPLQEGMATLRWPENLSASSFEDFEGWIQLVLRKAKRSISYEAPPE
jgi:hypothetical protein